MKAKSWPVALATSSFAVLVTLVFLLIPTVQQVTQIPKNTALDCYAWEAVIGDLRDLQQIDKPDMVQDVGPLFRAVGKLNPPSVELAAAKSELEALIAPSFLYKEINVRQSLKTLLNSTDVQEVVNRVEGFCD